MLGVVRLITTPRVTAVAVVGASVVALATPALATSGTVDQLRPTYGPIGTVVDITGTGLSTATDVTFNAVDAGPPTVVDDTHIQSTVPDGATSGPVAVTTADGVLSGPTFSVQVPTSASAALSRDAVVFPHGATVTATLTAAAMPVNNQPARLQRSIRGSGVWSGVQHQESTDSSGQVSWQVAPRATSSYRVVFAGSAAYLGTTTNAVRLHLHSAVALHVPSVMPTRTDTTIRGTVRPKPAHGRVVIERRQPGQDWQRVAATPVGGKVHFRVDVSVESTGRYAYRALRAPDGTHGGGVSAIERVRAVQRSLRTGDTGPDVRALQRRLTVLHYDLGGVTGTYDYDTLHAVVAFEKVQGLPRDGVVGGAVWKALDDPKIPRLRHPDDAQPAGVEVDLKHQIVLYAVEGKVRRIFDSSTGGGYYYTGSDGTQQQAITPTGHFSVVYKRDGWVKSKLGTLYRPAYFNDSGYAIHGEGDVPPYPASHGCVRITVPAMDRLNAKLPIGLSVWIY